MRSTRSFERISAADGDLKNADYRVEFEGRAEILRVDDKGEPVRLAFAITRFTRIEGCKVHRT